MSNQYNSYNKTSRQQTLQTSPIYKYNSQSSQSPFKKCLAVIPESQVGDYRRVHIQTVDSVIQSPQFLCQSYSQGLLSSLGLNKQQSGQIVSEYLRQSCENKQMLLTVSIQQKQKQLKQLQTQLFMIRNTNQCLREMIKQNNMQKDRLVEEMQVVKRQNSEHLQRIARLQQQLASAGQRMAQFRQPQDERYFALNSIMPKSQYQLVEQNESLKASIQQVKRMYQREIDILLVRHGEEVVNLQSKWSALVKEKDALIREMERRKEENQLQMNRKVDGLKEEVGKLRLEKQEMLREYLQTIQTMRGQLSENIKPQLNNHSVMSNPILISQPYIIDSQPTRDNIPIGQCCQQSLVAGHKSKRNINGLQRQNQLLRNMMHNYNKSHTNKSLLLYEDEELQRGYRSMQLPGVMVMGNSLQSLRQRIVAEDVNNTIVSDGRGMRMLGNVDYGMRDNNNNFRRQLSKQRSSSRHKNLSSSTKLSHLLYSSKHKLPSASTNPLPISSHNTNSINSKLLRDIDNKLDRIKYQINKEITY